MAPNGDEVETVHIAYFTCARKKHKISSLNTAQHLYLRSRRPKTLFERGFVPFFTKLLTLGWYNPSKIQTKLGNRKKQQDLGAHQKFLKRFYGPSIYVQIIWWHIQESSLLLIYILNAHCYYLING